MQTALRSAGVPVPSPVVIDLFIDTGADNTSIDSNVLAQFNLKPTGTARILTPTTGPVPVVVPTFEVELVIPGAAVLTISDLTVCEGDFTAMGHHGLLGRDILDHCRMTYAGPDKIVLLSF